MFEVLEGAKGLGPACEKLIGAVQSVIGKAYEPRHIRKIADAKAYEIATIGQAIRESSDIPITYDKGNICMENTDLDSFVKRTQNRLAYQELSKQNNIESVVDNAYGLLEGETAATDPIDSDWLLRFFNSVQDVSNIEMQQLWSKILAGEIKKPASFSLRTLEALRNISTEEAYLFQKICDYKINIENHSFIPRYDSLLESIGITYSDIMKMDECGLINSSGLIILNRNVSRELTLFAKSQNIVITVSSTTELPAKLSINQYPFSAIGIEISKLFVCNNKDSYFLDFARELKKIANNVSVYAYKIIDERHGLVHHELSNLIADF